VVLHQRATHRNRRSVAAERARDGEIEKVMRAITSSGRSVKRLPGGYTKWMATMTILRFFYAGCNLFAIGAGTIVLVGLLTGELLDSYFMLVKICSMLSILVSGMAILSWRMFHLSAIWSSVFAFTITILFYLKVVVVIDQAFMQISGFTRLAPAQFELTFRATQFVVMLLFSVIGIVVAKRFRTRGAHSMRSNTNGVADKHAL
jgi:hypothetical protein